MPHPRDAPLAIRAAATALNTEAHRLAIHAIHVAAIAANCGDTTRSALIRSYLTLEKEARDVFARTQRTGGLLFAFQGSKAFDSSEVAA